MPVTLLAGNSANRRENQSVHAPYLMVLLRIPDFLQIQAERAPNQITDTGNLNSPFSNTEWKIHQSVHNITGETDDPESIWIETQPENIQVFLRVQNWLQSLQTELDKSWAVLGEVYGRSERLQNLKIRLRRINSNIDDLDTFKNEVLYLPERVAFEAASSDLLSLLVGPLYGHKPEIGIRELTQNAVDAVRERYAIEGEKPTELVLGHDADVVIEVVYEDGSRLPHKVIVADRGTGMTPEIIRNYFLKAGASYKDSEMWKAEHEDDSGHAKIIRSGRFGVGALAAFLIGDEMLVSTRHFKSNTGYSFNADLHTDAIEISVGQKQVGTTLEIPISENYRSFFKTACDIKLGFFFEPFPKVLLINTAEKSGYDPQPDQLMQNFPGGFNDVYHPELDGLSWALPLSNVRNAPIVTLNGIRVSKTASSTVFIKPGIVTDSGLSLRLGYGLAVDYPSVAISDKNGIFPPNLERTNFVRSNEIAEKKLLEDMSIDAICRILLMPEAEIFQMVAREQKPRRWNEFCNSLFSTGFYQSQSFFFYQDQHFAPIDRVLFNNQFEFLSVSDSETFHDIKGVIPRSYTFCTENPLSRIDREHSLEKRRNPEQKFFGGNFQISEFSAYVDKEELEMHEDFYPFFTHSTKQVECGHLINFQTSNFEDPTHGQLHKIMAKRRSLTPLALIIFQGKPVTTPLAEMPDDWRLPVFWRAWRKLFGNQMIPVNEEERLKKFPKVFKELEPRLAKYRAYIESTEDH